MDEELGKFSYIWTTEKDNYWLIKGNDNRFSIVYKTDNSEGFMIIEDDSLHDLVVQKMIEAGCVQMTLGEYLDYFDSLLGPEYRIGRNESDIE